MPTEPLPCPKPGCTESVAIGYTVVGRMPRRRQYVCHCNCYDDWSEPCGEGGTKDAAIRDWNEQVKEQAK